MGYPITQRFEYDGFLTQGFQKLVLQWRPELGQAVPLNVFDELGERGFDTWLEPRHQVPRAPDLTQDLGLPWDAVIERHLSLLDAYPALEEFYTTDSDAMTRYGLPLSVQAYGPFSTVRLQRGTLQLWTTDAASAAAGTVVVGNGGDVAKEAGLWPREAVVPASAPLVTAHVEGE